MKTLLLIYLSVFLSFCYANSVCSLEEKKVTKCDNTYEPVCAALSTFQYNVL